MKAIFKSIQSICDEARRALDDPELSRDQLLSALSVRMMPQLARIPETLIAVLTATHITISPVCRGILRVLGTHRGKSFVPGVARRVPRHAGDDPREDWQ